MESKPIVHWRGINKRLKADLVSEERLTERDAEEIGLEGTAPSNINVRRSSNVRVKQP